MDEDWITNDEKFDTLTEAIQKTMVGGVLRQSDLSDPQVEILEEGVEDNVVSKKRIYKCRCGKRYTLENIPNECSRGHEIAENPSADLVHYVSDAYPAAFKEIFGERINGFDLKYDRHFLDEVPISELEPSPSDSQYIHISPFYDIEDGVHIYPNYEDIFVSWDRIGDLIEDWESLRDDFQNFLKLIDDGRRLEDKEDAQIVSTGPQSSNHTVDTGWYTRLHSFDKDTVNQMSQTKFGRSYNLQFERLGNECLRFMFPRGISLPAGGSDQPDGYLLFNDRAYMVESKCYSSQFKIASEQDKANRYVKRFTEMDSSRASGYNLCGYIFIAHEFNQNEFAKDLRSFKKSNIRNANLDVICLNDRMMEYAANELPDLYRDEPSSPQRIYENSDHYHDMLDHLVELTGPNTVDEDRFKRYIDVIVEDARENMATGEKEFANALERGSSIGQKLDKAFAN